MVEDRRINQVRQSGMVPPWSLNCTAGRERLFRRQTSSFARGRVDGCCFLQLASQSRRSRNPRSATPTEASGRLWSSSQRGVGRLECRPLEGARRGAQRHSARHRLYSARYRLDAAAVLLDQAAAPTASVASYFAVYRNIDALYDVLTAGLRDGDAGWLAKRRRGSARHADAVWRLRAAIWATQSWRRRPISNETGVDRTSQAAVAGRWQADAAKPSPEPRKEDRCR